jgi:hypothetical protein
MDYNSLVDNLQAKSIKDFGPQDTLYVRKMERGYSFHYLCQFIKMERGVVHVKVIKSTDGRGLRDIDIPKTLSVKACNCYLWGKDADDDQWERCHWWRNGVWK